MDTEQIRQIKKDNELLQESQRINCEIIERLMLQYDRQAETIRCQQQVLDQIAHALGLEPGDVDGIGAAIERLKQCRPYFDMTFDGWAVYEQLNERERSFVTAEHVSRVLDALNRAAKKALAAGEAG